MLRENSALRDASLGRDRAVLATRTGIATIGQGLEGGNQMLLAIANQVSTAHGFQGFAQQGPVVRIVVAQKRFVQAAAALTAHHIHRFAAARDAAQRVAA